MNRLLELIEIICLTCFFGGPIFYMGHHKSYHHGSNFFFSDTEGDPVIAIITGVINVLFYFALTAKLASYYSDRDEKNQEG